VVGTLHDVVVSEGYSMVVNLTEHPEQWIDHFRPRGTHLEPVQVQWRYEVSFFDGGDSTTVEVRAT
jgi:hypothetical protein